MSILKQLNQPFKVGFLIDLLKMLILLKGTVSVIFSDPPCKDSNTGTRK